jgi:hypothetical protein
VIFSTTSAREAKLSDADGGDHVDAGRQQFGDVLPPGGVTRAGRVTVRQLIYQRDLGPAREHCA